MSKKKAIIYLDESGDLGWTFDKPYNSGGSSRYLTISALVIPTNKKYLTERLIRSLYNKFRWKTSKEKKWSQMSKGSCKEFAEQAEKLIKKEASIKYFSITVRKDKVKVEFREDPNILYNYMIRLLLIDEMSRYDFVKLMPDERSIKVKSGNSLHDYLQTYLWYEKGVITKLVTRPGDSKTSLNIQFADMLAGLVRAHFEEGTSEYWDILSDHICHKKLFF